MFVQNQDLSERPLELIERELESLAAQIAAGSARWLELVAEFDRRTGWANTGCRSTCEWVAWRCALTPRAAREHVRVARALRELPEIRERFASGELSYSKVRALTRVADADSEAELVELARHATAAQLERMVCAARRVSAAEADQQHRDSYVRWYWDDDDGCLHLDAEAAARPTGRSSCARWSRRATRSMSAASARPQEREEDRGGSAGPPAASEPGGSAEPPPPALALGLASPLPGLAHQRRVARRALRGGAGPAAERRLGPPSAERYQVVVHVDAETLATDSPGASVTGPGACAIADGPGISPETARRLACDAALVTLVEGTASRSASGAERARSRRRSAARSLARDGRCQFPGCERRRFVDAHHIVHWARGGETTSTTWSCSVAITTGSCTRAATRSTSPPRAGGAFATRRALRSPPLPRRRPIRRRWRRPRGAPLTGTGEKMDLGYCVDAVLGRRRTPLSLRPGPRVVRWKIPWASRRALRPGGIAKVVAECSMIAGPGISWPALDVVEPDDRGLGVAVLPAHRAGRGDGRLARGLVELGQGRLLDLDRAVDDRLGDQVAELGRARRAGVDLRVGLLERVDELVDVLALLHLHAAARRSRCR